MLSIRHTNLVALIALLLGSAILVWQKENTLQIIHSLSPASSTQQSLYTSQINQSVNVDKIIKSGNPVSLKVTSLDINLAVEPGVYDSANKTWNVSPNKAHYATNTPLPNDSNGNTLIYGHNKKGVLNTLYKIQPNAELIITTDNNLTFTYQFIGSQEVSPNDDSLFSYKGPSMVTIQTCSGSFYQNRQLFGFKLISVSGQETKNELKSPL